MYFKNVKTGLEWFVTDERHQDRLLNDENYEVIEKEKADYSSLEWQELRSLASDKGIKTHGKKREEIETSLEELEG